MLQGVVLKSTGSNYLVRQSDGVLLQCKLKGNFRIKGIRTTNPIAVGDRVLVEWSEQSQVGWITEVEERHNCIVRKSINLSKQSHMVAANIDKAFLIVSLKNPLVPLGFIDRYLIAAESFQIPVILVFNKIDIHDDKALETYAHYRYIYESIGYKCIEVSAEKGYQVHLILQRSLTGQRIQATDRED